MNKLSVVLAFGLNPDCFGLRMLWIWIYLFNRDCKIDVNNLSKWFLCNLLGTFYHLSFSNGFYHANIPVSQKFTIDFFLWGKQKILCPCLIISFRNYRIQVALFLCRKFRYKLCSWSCLGVTECNFIVTIKQLSKIYGLLSV